MSMVFCIAAVVVLAALGAAVVLAVAVGNAQEEIDNIKFDRDGL
jgi:cytochrome oxidase Cu insertion factor (SCO1/SenC/PrrC family)